MTDTMVLPPHSPDAEESLLGAILTNPEALPVVAFLKPDDFYITRNGWAFEAILAIRSRNEAVDYLTVINELRTQGKLDEIGGPARITYLLGATYSPYDQHIDTYGRLIERTATRRRLLQAASEIAKAAHSENTSIDNVIASSERALYAATARASKVKDGSLRAVLLRVNEDIEQRKKASDAGKQTGVPTGLADVDALMGGLQRSDLFIVAARPGMGKTSWLLNVALHAARQKARVGLVTMEMSDEQLGQRFVAMDTGIPTDQFRTGRVSDWGLLVNAIGMLGELPIMINDSPTHTPSSLRAQAWRWKREDGLDLLMVDYIGLMDADGKVSNDVQRISQITRMLKQLARELDIPVIAAAQLNRQLENRQDKRPKLSDLRDSGSVEQDADVVLFIYRDIVYNPQTFEKDIAELIIAKHRNGPTDTVKVKWTGATTKFSDMTLRTAHTPDPMDYHNVKPRKSVSAAGYADVSAGGANA